MSRLLFAVAYTLPVVHLAALELRGPWVWLPLVYVFGMIPLGDRLVGPSRVDDDEVDARPRESRIHDLWLELWAPMQLALLGWTMVQIHTLPPVGHEWLGLGLSMGLVTGAGGINVAHELMHRSKLAHRGLGELLMTSVFYAHFCVEHVLGHHKHVATPRDPATSRRGEWLYAFWVRAIAQSVPSAWRLEARRAAKHGIAWTLRDRRLRMALTQTALAGGLLWFFGLQGFAFYAGQALFGVLLLETVDYIEHYGLQRRELSPGRYERVQPHHSWNSSHVVSSAHLFQLPRHSDHHANASRPYHRLRTLPGEAPLLPAGYPAMMLTALVPPLFFRWVDPLVEVTSAGHQS
jgi:alkane 1-monooxygenase